jgi:hypothetical protein
MDRRDFVKLCSLAGLGVVGLGTPELVGTARAGAPKFWVFVNAGGGWDPTVLCDPKGKVLNSENFEVNKSYAPGDIGTAGNIKYAPIGNGANKKFFDRFSKILTVINGIDCETNGHDSGQRNTFSGRLAENTPALPALLAYVLAKQLPMSFITNGGYDFADGIMAPTRVGNVGALTGLIFPNRLNPQDEKSEQYFTDAAVDAIHQARDQRLMDLQGRQHLPRAQNAMSLLYTSRVGTGNLKKLQQYLPMDFNNMSDLARQGAIALAAYKAGLCNTVELSIGGFDTHGNHDQQHEARMAELVNGIGEMYDRAEALGVAGDMFVMVGSDFGRTPKYNANNGKDHWSVGSVMIMSTAIPGNRVIGATDDLFAYKKVDLATLKVGGSDVIKNGHIHKWIRKFAGIENDPVVRRYPILTEGDLNLG